MRASAKPGEERTLALDIGGEAIPFSLKRHPRARRFSVRVKPATREVVLVAPPYAPRAEALAFVYAHSPWIARRLAELPRRVAFAAGAIVPLRGRGHLVRPAPGERGGVWIESGEPPRLCVAGAAEHLARRLGDFLRGEARRDLETAVAAHAGRLGLPRPRIALKDTSSRWGSCSPRSGLSFSWRLILAPAFVLDYVAAHECAHLRHMNHGPAFWRLLGELSGDIDRAEAWLKREGAGLHAYGPARRAAA